MPENEARPDNSNPIPVSDSASQPSSPSSAPPPPPAPSPSASSASSVSSAYLGPRDEVAEVGEVGDDLGEIPVRATAKFFRDFECSELGNATLLARMNKSTVRYDYGSKSWLVRDGDYWRPDNDGEMARKMCRASVRRKKVAEALPDTEPQPMQEARREQIAWAKASNSSRIIKNSVELAGTLKDLFIPPNQLDQDSLVIGTHAGVFDLTTGKKIKPAANVFISKMTAVAPAPIEDCPYWKDFLRKLTKDDPAAMGYLKRLAGYSLTGETREQSLVWFIGEGGGGKGTFLDTLLNIFGLGERGYAHSMRVEALVMNRHDVHPTELLDLKGKRLVVTSETYPGRIWNGALLKKLSGGDPITARRVHQDSTTFIPTHKLLFMGNDEPVLEEVGEAERRRYQIFPCDVRFKDPSDPEFNPSVDHVRDRGFSEKLRKEYPYILRWVMNGTLEWLQVGLDPPPLVLSASHDFLKRQDLIGQWIEADCEVGFEFSALTADCYHRHQIFRKRLGEQAIAQRAFTNELAKRKHPSLPKGKEKLYHIMGLRLREVGLAELAEEPTESTEAQESVQ